MEDVEPPQPEKQSEPLKKKMPLITTYNSEEEEDEDVDGFENYMHLTDTGVPPFPTCDIEVIDLVSESTPPPSSDSSSDNEELKKERTNAADLMSKCGQMSVVKWLNSSTFQELRRLHASPATTVKDRVPRSFVLFFYETLNAAGVSPLSATAMADRSFGTIIDDAMIQWKRLSPEERRVYRKRALHSTASYTQQLLSHRAKLRSLTTCLSVPRCNASSCQQSVVFDPRWNLDYCSTACLVANCKATFQAWLRPSPSPTNILISPLVPLPVTIAALSGKLGDTPQVEEEKFADPVHTDEKASNGPSESVIKESPMEVVADGQYPFRGNLFDRIHQHQLA